MLGGYGWVHGYGSKLPLPLISNERKMHSVQIHLYSSACGDNINLPGFWNRFVVSVCRFNKGTERYTNFWQGGALRSESWRSKVDHLLITIATDSCKGGWANEARNTFLPNGPRSTCADFQLAALHALLASLLSPSRVRPPHLARALELFRRGKPCRNYRKFLFILSYEQHVRMTEW